MGKEMLKAEKTNGEEMSNSLGTYSKTGWLYLMPYWM